MGDIVRHAGLLRRHLVRARLLDERHEGRGRRYEKGRLRSQNVVVEMPEVDLDDSKGILRQRFDQVIERWRIRMNVEVR